MDTSRLANEHREMIDRTAALAGLARCLRDRADAEEAARMIAGLDRLMADHLEHEDRGVYQFLMADPDPALRTMASSAFVELGALAGAWRQFRDHWSAPAILAAPEAFTGSVDCVLGALMLRAQFEEEALYPAARRATLARSRTAVAA